MANSTTVGDLLSNYFQLVIKIALSGQWPAMGQNLRKPLLYPAELRDRQRPIYHSEIKGARALAGCLGGFSRLSVRLTLPPTESGDSCREPGISHASSKAVER